VLLPQVLNHLKQSENKTETETQMESDSESETETAPADKESLDAERAGRRELSSGWNYRI